MSAIVKTKRPYKTALRQEQAQMTRQRILDAALRLLVSGTYSSLTMEGIATEAGVAYQTVYSIFGTKLRLAHSIIESGFPHVEGALKLFDQVRESPDLELHIHTVARVSRLIYGPCADLLRFMRESGDPALLARYREREEQRFASMAARYDVQGMLQRSGRLRTGLSPSDAVAVIWTLTGPDPYSQLVFDRGWTPSRYEQWVGDGLIKLLLEPA